MSHSHPKQIPKKILWVVHQFTSGGVGPVSIYAARALCSLPDYEATVVGLHEKKLDMPESADFPRMVGLELAYEDTIPFLDWLEINPHDVIITNDVGTLESCFPYFPEQLIHVIQVHDSGRRYISSASRNSQYADGILCVAEYFRPLILRAVSKNSFDGPVIKLHNGASFPDYPITRVPNCQLRLLFVGRMDPLVKGVFDLVYILKACLELGVNCTLTIVGGTNAVLEGMVSQAGIEDRVRWTGLIPHDECYALAASHDVLLMTSRKEPFGMVTIEAMAMGCVPVAWDIVAGTKEIVIDGESGFLVPLGSYRKFAKVLHLLHNNPKLLERASHAAIKRARSMFSTSELGSNLTEFLRDLKRREGRICLPGKPTGCGRRNSSKPTKWSYHGLFTAQFRLRVRAVVGKHPRISHWLLKYIL